MNYAKCALGVITVLSSAFGRQLSAAIVPDSDTILYVSGDVDYGLKNTATASDKFGKNYSKNDRLVTEGMVGGLVRSGRTGMDVTNGGFLFDTNGGGMSAEFTGASAYCSGDFTFECFLRLSTDATIDGNYGYVIRHANAWMLGFYSANGDLVLYNKSWGVLAKAGVVKDGLWHHVAVVQNRTRGKMALYVDYCLIGEGDYVVPLTDNTPANTFDVNCWSWDGSYNFTGATKKLALDEIRLVKRALSPADFIRTADHAQAESALAANLAKLTDADTLVYVSGLNVIGANINDLSSSDPSKPALVVTPAKTAPASVAPDKLETFRQGPTVDGAVVDNDACSRIVAKGRNGSAYATLADDSFMDEDFTLEFFHRYDDAGAFIKDATYCSAYLAYFGPMFYFASWDGSKVNFNAGGTSVYTPIRTDDGQWHHYAVTWDKSALTLRMYFDGALLVTKVYDSQPEHGTDNKKPLYIGTGCWNNREHDVGDCFYDEIRLTQRTLSPLEFLSARKLPIYSSTRAYLDFEQGVDAASAGLVVSPVVCRKKSNASVFQQDGSTLVATGLYARATETTDYTNTQALAISLNGHNNGSKGGGYIFDDPQYELSTGDFTVETFFKVEDWSEYWGYLLSCKDSWDVYLSNAENPTLGCNVAGQGHSGTVGLIDGAWHHVALVADSAAETVTVYLDYKVFHRFTGVKDPLKSGKTRPTALIYGGSAEDTYGLVCGPAKCRFDELRITKRALRVTEFLTDERLPDDVVRLWGRFEDASPASGTPAGKYALTAELSAGAVLAKGPRARPSQRVYACEGAAATANAYGAYLTSGTLTYSGEGVLDLPTATTEFFVRTAAGTVAVAQYSAGNGGWSLTAAGQLTITIGSESKTIDLSVNPFDAYWHHFAVAVVVDAGTTVVKAYVDRQAAGTASLKGSFAFTSPASLVFGSAGMSGGVDEVRVSAAELEPSDLMSCDPPSGIFVIVR